MECSLLKVIRTPFLPVSGDTVVFVHQPVAFAAKARALPQITRGQRQNLQAPNAISISRRDAMLYVAAEILSGVTLLSADPAEARLSRLENKKKVLEKLEKLKEGAGESKSNAEGKKPQSTNPQERRSVGPVMEAVLP